MLQHPCSLAMLLRWSTGGARMLQQGATPAATGAGGWASLPGRRMRICGFVGWGEAGEKLLGLNLAQLELNVVEAQNHGVDNTTF